MLTYILVFLLSFVVALAFSMLPALHIYNLAAILVLLWAKFGSVNYLHLVPVIFITFVVVYAVASNIPSIFLGAPDESAVFLVLPAQKYLLLGRGYEALAVTLLGSLSALVVLVVLVPFLPKVVPPVMRVIAPHLHWLLLLIVVYLLMSEWPKGTDRAPTKFGKFLDAWTNLFAGLFTFFASGFLGIIVFSKTLVPVERSFQALMPVFGGLFAVPWILQNIVSRNEIPPQHIPESADLDALSAGWGIFSGTLGGMFAATFPVVTGGIGGLLAGHATAQRDERSFIISQGVSKFLYYVGGFLLLFVPGLYLTRGGLAWMVKPIIDPREVDFSLVLGTLLLATGLSVLVSLLLARGILKILERVNYRVVSWITLGIIFLLVYLMTGPVGILLLLVSSAIGLVPVMFHSRRSNCLGVLFVPIILSMSGYMGYVLSFLGL